MKVSNLEEEINQKIRILAKTAPRATIVYNSLSEEVTTKVEWGNSERDRFAKDLVRSGYERDDLRGALFNEKQEISPFKKEVSISLKGRNRIWDEEEVYWVLNKLKKPIDRYINDVLRIRDKSLKEIIVYSDLKVESEEIQFIRSYIKNLEEKEEYGNIGELCEEFDRPAGEIGAIIYCSNEFKSKIYLMEKSEEELVSLIKENKALTNLARSLGYEEVEDFLLKS